MLLALSTVILTSLTGVIVPGPMFAVTLAKSLKSGWAGMWMSLGHAVVEVPLILLLFLGLTRYLQSPLLHFALGLVGGAMILWMAVAMFRARKAASSEERDIPHGAFVSGIILTGLNPLVLAWWITIGSLLLLNFLEAVGTVGLPLFILVHWLCDFVWLSVVSFSIFRTRRFWSPKVQEWTFIGLALLLAVFGAQFVVNAVVNYL